MAVIRQVPAPTRVSAPVDESTVHTLDGEAEYNTVPCAPLGAVTVGALEPMVTEEALYLNPLSA